jgi:hypothetical protein
MVASTRDGRATRAEQAKARTFALQIEVVLTGMADPPYPEDRLFIGRARHKAFIRVDEKGTPGGRRDGGHRGSGDQPRAKVRRAGRVADPSAT